MPKFTLIRPIFSEKAVNLAAKGVYTFEVGRAVNKIQIKKAVEDLFGVKVGKVRTANFKSELRRQGKSTGITKAFKKTLVKVAEGTINLWAPPEQKSKIKNQKSK